MSVGVRLLLGGCDHGGGAGVVDDLASPDEGHSQGPFACRWAAWIAVSVVMKSTFWSRPPKQKFTAPGMGMAPVGEPSGLNTSPPPEKLAYRRRSASAWRPSGCPGELT